MITFISANATATDNMRIVIRLFDEINHRERYCSSGSNYTWHGSMLHAKTSPLNFSLPPLTHIVLAQMLAVDGEYIFKETLQALIAACDVDPSKENMEMLFPQESYCTVAHFEEWIKTHASLASFSQWLLVEEETGFRLEGDPDPPTLYQTLAERYHGEYLGILPHIHSCTLLLYASWISSVYLLCIPWISSVYLLCIPWIFLDILCILIVHSLDILGYPLYTYCAFLGYSLYNAVYYLE